MTVVPLRRLDASRVVIFDWLSQQHAQLMCFSNRRVRVDEHLVQSKSWRTRLAARLIITANQPTKDDRPRGHDERHDWAELWGPAQVDRQADRRPVVGIVSPQSAVVILFLKAHWRAMMGMVRSRPCNCFSANAEEFVGTPMPDDHSAYSPNANLSHVRAMLKFDVFRQIEEEN